MNAFSWLLFLLAAAAAVAYTLYMYRTRETQGHGRTLLAALRASALVLLVLLVLDPELPRAGGGGGGDRTAVLLDASLSMTLPAGADSTTRWSQALQRVRASGTGDVLVFGSAVRAVPRDALAAVQPDAPTSRLLPALQAAAEGGARRALVVTDGGIEDAAEIARWVPRLGIEVDYEVVGSADARAAVAELRAPAWAEAGEEIPLELGMTGGADSADVVVLQDGRELARTRVAAAETGRIAPAQVAVTPEAAADGGLVRLEVRVEGDAASERSTYVYVSEQPAGIALVSFRPDWEPRFLSPVLETALGLPVRGFLRTGTGEYIRMGAGTEIGGRATDAEVQRAVEEAELVVLHGFGTNSPGWARDAAPRLRRLVLFPADAGAAGAVPIELPNLVTDDWYLSTDVPVSPVTALLTGIELSEPPPLQTLRPVTAPGDAWAPLLANRGRRGAGAPVLLAGANGNRRWAVALGEGYWRWAFRGAGANAAYARLWGAVAGWIVREDGGVAAAAVRPADRSTARGEEIAWIAPGLAADSVRVTITDASGTSIQDTVLPVVGDTARSPALPPAHYRYAVQAYGADGAIVEAAGPLSVEAYSPEFARAAVPVEALSAAATAVGPDADRRGQTRPLHASAFPYIALLLLLCAEWILRRRWGLR